MKHNLIVTIGRQFGSGGRDVGRKLAELLGIAYYDKQLLAEASRRSGICSEILEKGDERTLGSLRHALMHSIGLTQHQGLVPENLFKIQSDVIRDIAETEPCVIVGRSADYVLRKNPLCFNIFVLAPDAERIVRIMSRKEDVNEKRAKELMHKTDKSRASYYNFYTDRDWGNSDTYHLTIDSSLLGIDATAEHLKIFVLAALKAKGGTL